MLWRVVRDFNRCALPHSFRPAARGRRLRIRFAGGPGMGAHCELLLQIQTKLSMGKLAPKAAVATDSHDCVQTYRAVWNRTGEEYEMRTRTVTRDGKTSTERYHHTIRTWNEGHRHSESETMRSVLHCLNLTCCVYSKGGNSTHCANYASPTLTLLAAAAVWQRTRLTRKPSPALCNITTHVIPSFCRNLM